MREGARAKMGREIVSFGRKQKFTRMFLTVVTLPNPLFSGQVIFRLRLRVTALIPRVDGSLDLLA